MADEFEKLSESSFVVVSGLAVSQFEVHFGEVHVDGLWDESLEHLECEVEVDAVTFSGTSACKSFTVNSIDVEGDPVFGIVSMVEVLMDGLVNSV